MSTTSAALITAWSSESPQRALTDFLTKESSRYVPFPYMGTCDAIFVHRWFEDCLFGPGLDHYTERLFHLLDPDYGHATVMGIKHLVVNRRRENPEHFRLRWAKEDENFSEVFLIQCFGLADHVAVVPTSYMRIRYGDARKIEGVFEPNQACPSLFAPFMVHHQDLVKFLEQIYDHACASATSDLINPTYSATYHRWLPELQRLTEVIPSDWHLEKILSIRDLYFGCKLEKEAMKLSCRGEPGHFSLGGHAIEYWRKSWCRRGGCIRVNLHHQLSAKSPWKFLLLEDHHGKETICLPRNFVPLYLIGHTRHGRPNDSPQSRQIDVAVGSWTEFIFPLQTPMHNATMIASIIRNYAHQAECALSRSLGERDSG